MKLAFLARSGDDRPLLVRHRMKSDQYNQTEQIKRCGFQFLTVVLTAEVVPFDCARPGGSQKFHCVMELRPRGAPFRIEDGFLLIDQRRLRATAPHGWNDKN